MAIENVSDFTVLAWSVGLIVVVTAILAVAGRTDNIRRNYYRLFNKGSAQDSLLAFFLYYALFLWLLEMLRPGLLARMVGYTGLNEEAILTIVGSTSTVGANISYFVILIFGTLLYGIGLSVTVTYILNQAFDMKLDFLITYVITLWMLGTFLLILQVGIIVWIALLGLFYIIVISF